MQVSSTTTYAPYVKVVGGFFTFSSGTPVFIHDDGTWDFNRGKTMNAIWQAAQKFQIQDDAKIERALRNRICELDYEASVLYHHNKTLVEEVEMLKSISVLGIIPGEGTLIRVIKPYATRPGTPKIESSEAPSLSGSSGETSNENHVSPTNQS